MLSGSAEFKSISSVRIDGEYELSAKEAPNYGASTSCCLAHSSIYKQF